MGLAGVATGQAKPNIENPAMSIDLELVSTDGSNFKWKSRGSTSCCAYDSAFLITSEGISSRPSWLRWGSNHAHYKFGDLLIRRLLRQTSDRPQAEAR